MRELLRKENGSLAAAMLLALIGVMSGFVMSALAMSDTRSFHWEYEQIQGLHLLRSEAGRGQAILEYNEHLESIITPVRQVAVESSAIKRTFSNQSRIYKHLAEETESVEIQGGEHATGSVGESRDHYQVNSLIETSKGIGQAAYYGSNKTMARLYGELTIVQSHFSEFMYFTDNDLSPAGNHVYFYGKDVISGKVHSNSDIWIKKEGGGSNDGWPTFLDLVTTAKNMMSFSGPPPINQVFQGGLVEEYDGYEFPPLANELRAKGQQIGAGEGNIYIMRVNGAHFSGYHGAIGNARRVRKVVYDPYPPVGDTLWINTFTVRDTTWTPMPGGLCSNAGVFVNGELWLEGNFGSFQTWGSSGETYLIGDVKLLNTQLPHSPEGNSTDMVGIVSEKSITVKYAYVNPADSARVHPNMGADNAYAHPAGGGIFIYAALCALGDGGGSGFKDGVFTFEYMHPHPSTEPVEALVQYPDGEQEWVIFDWLDIHRRRYPPTAAQPWPSPNRGQPTLDLPWYNPIWPENRPYLERGTINIWGAVAQRRRGFVHRSGNDSEYPSNSGVWDIEIDMCGHPISTASVPDPVFSQLLLASQNYPGTSGGGVGYDKNYNYDNRMKTRSPLLYPAVRLKGGKNPMAQGNWSISKPPRSLF